LQKAMDDRENEKYESVATHTLTDWMRLHLGGLLDPLARRISQLGVHPNTVSLVGFALQVAVGALLAAGHVRVGGLLLLVAAPFDALDGAVARVRGNHGPFGAFLDSTLDRLADAVLILGLTAHQMRRGATLEVWLLLVALVASFMVSYTRARAEALAITCKVGLLTRLERILLIAVLSLLALTSVMAWALAILSVFTVLQRMLHVYLSSAHRD